MDKLKGTIRAPYIRSEKANIDDKTLKDLAAKAEGTQYGVPTHKGYGWICPKCKYMYFIAMDMIILTTCNLCNSKLINLPLSLIPESERFSRDDYSKYF